MNNKARIGCGLVFAIALYLSYGANAQGLFGNLFQRLIPHAAKPALHNLFPKSAQKNLSEQDEAMEANITAEHQALLEKGSSEDYFHDMDYGITNRPAEVKAILSNYVPGITEKEAVDAMARGRNNWNVWTFGNDKFWSNLGRSTFGGLDFIKTISSHDVLPASRSNRWTTLGLVNEPCFRQATGPRADRWGLRLDERIVSSDCPADPFENEKKYPGIKTGSRGTTLKYKGKKIEFPVGSFYGYPTGIVGFRLFPNPEFDQKAADRWDPERYYNDPTYFNDSKLVRPYRVGVSCALCHVGPNPSNPPADFNNPTWANLNSNPGAQYFWVDRIFMWNWKKTAHAKFPDQTNNFIFQLIRTSRPGALDTSLVSSDQINNPRTMNAVYDLPARLTAGIKFNSYETLTGDELLNKQFGNMNSAELPEGSMLRRISQNTNEGLRVISPRVLKDGSDSVGALGALNRVYVNIGLFSEEWVNHFIPLIGGNALSPFPIKVAQENSAYWKANVKQTPDLALFFLGSARPDKLEVALKNAPTASVSLKDFNGPEVSLGKKVFAENCAACHSSKIPDKGYSYFNNPKNPNACRGPNYLGCWEAYWNYAKSAEFKSEMTKMVEQKDFLDNNFLSTDQRVPMTLIDTQLCSSIATNAIKGDIWDNFSSTSYKELTSIGNFVVNYPTTTGSELTNESIQVPGGGRGYLRPPSLISAWSSAPFFQNNALGLYDDRGTVEGRMRSFEDSIAKLLNPEKRADPGAPARFGSSTKAVYYMTNEGYRLPGTIDVTPQETYIKIPKGYIPKYLQGIIDLAGLTPAVGKNLIQKKGKEYVTFPGYKPVKPIPVKKEERTIASTYEDGAEMDPKRMGDDVMIGPIPAGVPVNLLSNLNLERGAKNTIALTKAITSLVTTLTKISAKKLTGAEALRFFMQGDGSFLNEGAALSLVGASKCEDFVVDRGHYFGTQYAPGAKVTGSTGLTADEKSALIEYLKYF